MKGLRMYFVTQLDLIVISRRPKAFTIFLVLADVI